MEGVVAHADAARPLAWPGDVRRGLESRIVNPRARWTARTGACAGAALLLGTAASAAAESGRLSQQDTDVALHARLPFRVFTARDGLPQNSILNMAVDHSGHLWVGTLDGAARYDGRSWTVVNMPDRTVSNQVTALLSSADGSVWFGTAGAELARLKDGQWTRYGASSGLPGVRIRSLVESTDPGGGPMLWVGTDAGLGRLAQGRFSVVDQTSGLPDNDVLALLETPTERGGRALWVGTGAGGLSRLESGRWSTFPLPASLAGSAVRSLRETRDETNRVALWVGTDAGLARLQASRWSVFDTRTGLPSNRVEALLESRGPDGSRFLWIACYAGGLVRFEKGRLTVYGAGSGLPTTRLRSLIETLASDGSPLLWVGTAAGGLARLKQGHWVSFDTGTGLPNSNVRSFLETTAEGGRRVFWVGTAGGGLARFAAGRWRVFDTAAGLTSNLVHSLVETRSRDGSVVWAGTEGGGLARFAGGRWAAWAGNRSLPDLRVETLRASTSETGTPVLWVGTIKGLARLEGDRLTVYTTANGLPHEDVVCLLETELEGRRALWVGTREGLARLEDGRWSTYGRSSGLPNDKIWSLLETRTPTGSRILWAGTLGGGVAWTEWNSPAARWSTISDSSTPALPNNVVYQIQEDARGRLYLFTNKGIARLTPRWRQPLGDSTFDVETFTTEDGLPSNEFNGGASLVDGRGRIWGGSVQGAVMLDPLGEHPSLQTPPPLAVTALVAPSMRQIVTGEALAHDSHLVFELTLPSLFRESDTRYRTQLVGLDAAPSEWTSSYRTQYDRLPEGSYVLRAWARGFAMASSPPLEMPFRVSPAPWRSYWAYGLYLAGFAGLAHAALRLRIQGLRRKNAQLEDLVRRRTFDLEQALDQTGEAVQRAETLRAATEAVSQSLELEQVLGLILSELRKVVDYDSASVQELEQGGRLRIIGGVGFPNLDEILGLTFDVEDGQAPNGEVVRSQSPRILADTDAFPAFRAGVHAATRTRSWLGVPLHRGNRLIGLITLDKREPGFYTEEHARLATTFGHQAAISIENARLLAREREAHERAEQASRAKSAFVASMSHELRTPLHAVLGFAQLMARRPGRDSEDREHLAAIGRGGEHLLRLINDVLSLAKIEAGQLSQNVEDFDLQALLRSVNEMFRPRGASKGLAFVFEAPPSLPRSVRGDQGKLRQILINLIGNAIKFSDSGRVTLRVAWHAGRALFSVEDSGPGLTPEEISRLFAAFFQAEAGRKLQDGTGLGLALSRSYARLMGGDVTVSSEVGGGSTFRLDVPLPESTSAAEPARPPQGRVRSLAPGQRRRAILVADDDSESRTILSKLLGSVGFEVRTSAHGREALTVWREWRPDFVFMDINMPGLDGLEATQAIRAEERERDLPRTPVVAVSASAFEHERASVLAAGCDGFVAKPFKEEDVFESIGEQLGVRYVRDAPQPAGDSGSIEVTRERVRGLPAEWRLRFREALESWDKTLAERLLAEIEAQDAPLARELLSRVKSYRLAELEELVAD